jgi:hypothetical protein
MINIIEIILLFIIAIFIYKYYIIYNKKPDECFSNKVFVIPQTNNNINVKPIKKPIKIKKQIKPKIKFDNKLKHVPNKVIKTNPYFQEIKFHQDYRDTIDAFDLMCNQKNMFNNTLEPVKTSKPNISEVEEIINDFINTLNNNILENVNDIAGQKLNSWNENVNPINQYNDILNKNSSWNEYTKELGLPNSIYPEPATKSIVKLINIDNVEKYETSKELKYTIFLIIQKQNVVDQMLVKINFLTEKTDINLEREFFDSNKNTYNTKILIEEITIIGFMILEGSNKSKSQKDKFYNFDELDGKLISEKEVIKQLNDKKRQIEKNFISSL